MEQYFLQEICKGRTVKRPFTNGSAVSYQAIADRLEPAIKAAQRHNSESVVVLDRENREDTCAQIVIALTTILATFNGIDIERVHIFVANRKTENWIIGGLYDEPNPENINGAKGFLKNKLGGTYNETTDGVRMLKSACPRTIAVNCPSFKELFDNFPELGCWWLDKA